MLKKFSVITAIVIATTFSMFVGEASAESATVYSQSSCSINGVTGTGTTVFQGSDLLLTSCRTGSQTLGRPVVIRSGNCVTVDSTMNVCAGNRQ